MSGILAASAGCRIWFGYPALPLTNGTTQIGVTDVLVWGGQVELGGYPTSYIPTTSAAVTRAADLALLTGTNFSSWYNASAGTIIIVFDVPYITTAIRTIGAPTGTGNERVGFFIATARTCARRLFTRSGAG